MPERQEVLFVCTGNICRSPTAEGVFRQMVRQAGLEAHIGCDSAGTAGFHQDEPPDARTQAHARRRGYDLTDLRARAVVPDDFHRFTIILAMDRGHLRDLRRRAPSGTQDKIRLFLDYAPRANHRAGPQDVPDPYYGGARGFEEVLDLVEAGCRGLLDTLTDRTDARI